MSSLSLTEAAARVQLAPKTLKAWHAAGAVTAEQVGRRGVPWRFDVEELDREVAARPRCAYARGCDRPVLARDDACQAHRLAVEIEGRPRAREIVEKAAATIRKHEDGDFHCEEPGCGQLLREHRGWRIAKRRAASPDGVVRCGSCAAKRRHEDPDKANTTGRLRSCPSCGGGPDWVMPHQEHVQHCHRCFRSAPDVREKRAEAMSHYLSTPVGAAAHALALTGARAFHAASSAALPEQGLVPSKQAAAMLGVSPTRLGSRVEVERRTFGGVARVGVNAREVVRLSVDQDARRKLSKPLAVLNGAKTGHPGKLSSAELDLAARLHAEKPSVWSSRRLAAKLNRDRRSAGEPLDADGAVVKVSHMTVYRRVIQRAKQPL